jgi:hypothetical protein
MSMLSFMPWFNFGEQLDLPGFSLLPFRPDLLPFGKDNKEQKTIEAIFDFYHTLTGPVPFGTIIRLGDHGVLDELAEQEREEIFRIAGMVGFSGLAARRFFCWGEESYCNADLFTCYVQAFSDPFPGAAIYSRRRDGQKISSGHRSVYKVHCPFHIPRSYSRGLDQSLLKALNASRSDDWASSLFEAIAWFNLANTDSDNLHEPMELVGISGAVESALGLSNGKEHELSDAWKSTFLPAQPMAVSKAQREVQDGLKKYDSVREAWIRDLYRLRHSFAHGRQRSEYKATWTLKEHLLLASLGFPLLVKSILAKRGAYTFDTESRRHLDSFERLAAMPELFSEKSQAAWKDVVAGRSGEPTDEFSTFPAWGRS